MTMYKRPPLRVREQPTKIQEPVSILTNTFLHKITNPEPTVHYKNIKQAIYQKDAYLKLLKKNNEECNIPWVERDIPDYEAPVKAEVKRQPSLEMIDCVYLDIRILKSGIIRVKLNTLFASLYENYYSQAKKPPLKLIIQAYKSRGFDDQFLERVKKLHEKRLTHAKNVSKAIDLIFNKETVKKIKKTKSKEEVKIIEEPKLCEEEDIEEDEDEDDGPEEDEALDVEVDEDLEEQDQEEVYFSDGGDD